MLERSSLPTYVSTEITDSLQQTFDRRRFEVLQEILWLPETFRQYLFLLIGALIVGAGMCVHIWLNVQIAEEQMLLRELATQRQQIERENSEVIFAIANSATLTQVENAALQQGYRPATERVYVRRNAVRGATPNNAAEQPAAAPVPPAPINLGDAGATDTGFLDAVGRGLGAAGEWLQQSAVATAQAIGGFTSGLAEHWMP